MRPVKVSFIGLFFVKVSIYTVKLRFTSNPGVTIITVNIYILYTFQTLKL